MPQTVWRRTFPAGFGLEKALAATRAGGAATGMAVDSTAGSDEAAGGGGGDDDDDDDGFTLASFTASDAWELGHLVHARLQGLGRTRPALVSISGGGGAVLFQSATGPGTTADQAAWVQRKRRTVERFGVSSWAMGRRFGGDAAAFAAKYGLGPERAGGFAIHGGGVPIRVHGVEGVVAVVVVSGLTQREDHGVIVEVVRENWEPELVAE